MGGLKRVLMTGDTVGGVWTFTLELARELCARGIEVYLAAFGGPASYAQLRQAHAIAGLRLSVFDLKLEWMPEPWRDVEQSASILAKLERDFEPDVVHLNTYGHGDAPWQVPVVLTAHSCVASWWEAVRGEALPDSWGRYRNAVEQSIRVAAAVAAPSRSMLDSLTRQYQALPRQMHVIANGRSADAFSSSAKRPFIFSAGRLWDEAKNIASLARVADRLPWPVYVAGPACNPDGAEIAFNQCRQVGPLSSSSMADWLACASIYAAPAKYEPFGLSVLEAGLSGCALVLGDIPSLREIWLDAALFAGDSELEGALQQLIGNSNLRQEFSSRAQTRAREFTATKMGAAYLGLYESVTGRRHACAG